MAQFTITIDSVLHLDTEDRKQAFAEFEKLKAEPFTERILLTQVLGEYVHGVVASVKPRKPRGPAKAKGDAKAKK